MALRTRFIDDEVMRAISADVRQFVLVGAGYDGRALRFQQAGTRWFEVDHPSTQPDKQRRIAALPVTSSGITFVPVDLLRDDVNAALASAGHDHAQPSLFVCEGLFAYLPNDVVAHLCSRLRAAAAPGSVLVASVLVLPAAGGGAAQLVVDFLLKLLGERRLGVFRPGVAEAVLREGGWVIRRQATSRNDDLRSRQLLLLAAEPL